MPLKVILDANFLLVPLQFRIDVFEDIPSLLNQRVELIILSTTLQELKRMAENEPPKQRKHAAMALELAEKCRIVNVEKKSGETSDEVLLRVATKWKSPVATNDRELRKKLRGNGVAVVFLRGKRRLELDGAV